VHDLSIVIPVLNDAPALARLLACLSEMLRGLSTGVAPASAEIIVVDGGSADEGCALAQRHGCVVVHGAANRGSQLQAGFARAQAEWIWFLHADSVPSAQALGWLVDLREPCWGRFDVRFSADGLLLKLVAMMMNWRSRRSGICTGDQGMFVHRSLLTRIGGVPPQSLMEDIELSRRLKREMAPVCPRLPVTTSSRRWEQRGTVRTIVSMWWFRLRYWLGADPEWLAERYYASRRGEARLKEP
jgi:rSAM/selenodomain-associated transferase 2